MPVTPRTTALFQRLHELGVAENHPATAGVTNALGVWPGDLPTDADYPVLGFHVTTTRDPINLTCYLVTVGRFVRYEWSPAASLLFSCGIERVYSVTERTVGEQLQVSIELDAQGSSSTLQAQSGPGPDGSVGSNAQLRHERTQYILGATEEHDMFALRAFSLGMRIALGA